MKVRMLWQWLQMAFPFVFCVPSCPMRMFLFGLRWKMEVEAAFIIGEVMYSPVWETEKLLGSKIIGFPDWSIARLVISTSVYCPFGSFFNPVSLGTEVKILPSGRVIVVIFCLFRLVMFSPFTGSW